MLPVILTAGADKSVVLADEVHNFLTERYACRETAGNRIRAHAGVVGRLDIFSEHPRKRFLVSVFVLFDRFCGGSARGIGAVDSPLGKRTCTKAEIHIVYGVDEQSHTILVQKNPPTGKTDRRILLF